METKPREIWQVEIRSRNVNRAAAFYGAVFDWTITPVADDYAMIDAGEAPIASILQPADTGFPLGVCNYVLVEDCAAEAERAVALGGRLVVQKWEIAGSGWFTGTVDPTGNEIFFWEPSRPGAPEYRGSKKNPIVLVEIPARDLGVMTAFYSSLLGWTFAGTGSRGDSAFAPGCGLARGVAIVAGPLAPRMQKTIDYVAVESLAAAEARVRAAGGRIVVGADAQPGEGPSFIFEDPERNRMGVTEIPG